jgi:hypothetical protein
VREKHDHNWHTLRGPAGAAVQMLWYLHCPGPQATTVYKQAQRSSAGGLCLLQVLTGRLVLVLGSSRSGSTSWLGGQQPCTWASLRKARAGTRGSRGPGPGGLIPKRVRDLQLERDSEHSESKCRQPFRCRSRCRRMWRVIMISESHPDSECRDQPEPASEICRGRAREDENSG